MSEMPEGRGRNNTVWIIVGVAALVLLLLLCCCVLVLGLVPRARYAASRGPLSVLQAPGFPWVDSLGRAFGGALGTDAQATAERVETFEIETPLVLTLDNQVGEVRVFGRGDVNTVTVRAWTNAWAASSAEAERLLQSVQVSIQQEAPGRISVRGSFPSTPAVGRSPSVVFEVEVPRDTDLSVSTSVGQISVEDVRGTMDLRTNVGQIRADNIEGSVELRSDVGEVDVRDFAMTGSSAVSTRVGEISVRLRRGAAFRLDAETNIGQIRTNLHVDGEQERAPVPGDTLRGDVRGGGDVTLTLRANTGAIRVDE